VCSSPSREGGAVSGAVPLFSPFGELSRSVQEHGEELQNNGQATKVARKQMRMGPELGYSNNNIHTVTTLIQAVLFK